MKHCKDCKFFDDNERCTHTDCLDVVYGRPEHAVHSRNEKFGKCGEKAILFKKRPPPVPLPVPAEADVLALKVNQLTGAVFVLARVAGFDLHFEDGYQSRIIRRADVQTPNTPRPWWKFWKYLENQK